MLSRRTFQCISRRHPLAIRPRQFSITCPKRLAIPSQFISHPGTLNHGPEQPLISPRIDRQTTSQTYDPSLVRSCTVLTSRPECTSLQDLLDRIPQFDPRCAHGLYTNFTLLVTPSYASSLLKHKPLLQHALHRILSISESSHHLIDLVSAVVDRLPTPDSPTSTMANTTSEGIALMTQGGATRPPLASRDPKAASLPDGSSRFIAFQMDSWAPRSSSHPAVQLPLSNTVFQNGMPATLIWRRYRVSDDGKSLVQLREQFCDQHRACMLDAHPDQQTDISLNMPLIPLTAARSVVACMGNIIRRLSHNSGFSPHDPTKDAILASQELEQSVTSYHEARNLSPRAVSVWALVIPEKEFSGGLSMATKALGPVDLAEAWKGSPADYALSSDPSLLTLLKHGARLHKVLSGGGGWGKKAGLLSLDPNTGYGQEHVDPQASRDLQTSASDADLDFDFDSFSRETEELKSIVKKGDYIQFYISPSASAEDVLVQSDPNNQDAESLSYLSTAEFGTIPSTVDDMPGAQIADDSSQSAIQVHPNHFGALSESGMALYLGNESDSHLPKDRTPFEPATKVDVPFGRLKYRVSIGQGSTRKGTPVMGLHSTTPLQSHMRSRISCGRKLTDQYDVHPTMQRRAFHVISSRPQMFPTRSSKIGQSAKETIWQAASKTSLTPRRLKKIQRIPKLPDKNWTSKDINTARKAMKNEKEPTVLKDVKEQDIADRERRPTLTTKDTISKNKQSAPAKPEDVPFPQLFKQSLEERKVQTWAKQGMQDVISPTAYAHWITHKSIPKHPDSFWTSKDIRMAFTFQKRQWKKKKVLEQERQRQANTVTTFKRAKLDSLQPKTYKPPGDFTKQKKKEEKPQDPPTIAALKQQAMDRARARILREAFRGLLSPAQQRRAITRQKSRSADQEYKITDPVLTQRIMHLVTLREAPHSPRIAVYELLDINRFPPNEELDTAIEKEKRRQRVEQLREEFFSWRKAAKDLRDVVKEKWPGETKKVKLKRVVDDELDEIRQVEDSVGRFLFN